MERACFKLALLATVSGLLAACTTETNGPGTDPSTAGGGAGGSAAAGGGAGGATAGAGGSSAGVGGGGSPAGGAGGNAGGGGGGQAGGGAGGSAGAAGAAGMAGSGGSGGASPFVLTSPVLDHVETCTDAAQATCDIFPSAHILSTIGGMNQSPELSWGAGPAGTMSYVVALHDTSNMFTHWVLWNIPATTLKLTANLPRQETPATPAGASQLSFSQSDAGYQGPGAKKHVYEFEVFALKVATLPPPEQGDDQEDIYDALKADADDIVLASSILRARSPD
jgi:Raf kinase inhibitor-like YbhB/YbcL family protein